MFHARGNTSKVYREDYNKWKKFIRDRYNTEAPTYNKTRSWWITGYFGFAEFENILKFLQGGSVLQVGCGTGRLASHLLKAGYTSYVGIDVSEGMLFNFDNQSKKNPQLISLILGDGEDLPFSDNVFDCVLISRVVKFLPEPARVLAEAYRVLKADGRIVLTTDFCRDSLFYHYECAYANPPIPPFENHYRCSEMVELVAKAGFNVIHQNNLIALPQFIYNKFLIPPKLWRFAYQIDKMLSRRCGGFVAIVIGEK